MNEQRNENPPVAGEGQSHNDERLDAERREALAKLAKWTPPAMLTLLLSTRASAESFGVPPPPP